MNDLEEYSDNVRMSCPNCGAANTLNVILCVACGISFQAYREGVLKLDEIQKERQEKLERTLLKAGSERLTIENAGSRRHFFRQILLAIVVLCIIGFGSVVFVINKTARIREQREQVRENYRTALDCMEKEEYLCALEMFNQVKNFQENEVEFVELENLIVNTHEGLGEQYFDIGEWEQAINQFDIVLSDDPGRKEISQLKQDAYEFWLQEAKERKRIFEVWRIQWKMDQ